MNYEVICRYVSVKELAKIFNTTTEAIRQRKYRKTVPKLGELIKISSYLRKRSEQFDQFLEKSELL